MTAIQNAVQKLKLQQRLTREASSAANAADWRML